jgi:hypothetical protein
MKLYTVEVTFKTVILAEDARDAENQAESIVKREDDTAETVSAFELTNIDELPAPWEPKCRPWGRARDPYDRTIGGILANNQGDTRHE